MSDLSRFTEKQQRLVPGSALSRPRQAAFAAAGVVVLSLTAAEFPTQPTVITAAAAATELKGAGSCANIDMVYQDKSAFPDTPQGRVAYILQSSTIDQAVLCLLTCSPP
ncbi:hypothetical protein [Streptosporangium sp. NPDC087985]|uniref:hypothetical protein n=1 Tax=Streptosporangium sp. NPDC087985 TaxID=3366196 RepID=UPI0037FC20B8